MKKGHNQLIRVILFTGIILGSIGAFLAQSEAQQVSQSEKKEIPKITFKNLSPPYKDYNYFQGNDEYPFREHANSFDLINAWWLAEASTLV